MEKVILSIPNTDEYVIVEGKQRGRSTVKTARIVSADSLKQEKDKIDNQIASLQSQKIELDKIKLK